MLPLLYDPTQYYEVDSSSIYKVYYHLKTTGLLTDMFAEDVTKDSFNLDGCNNNHEKCKVLPQGWSEKIDQQTGRPYYEW